MRRIQPTLVLRKLRKFVSTRRLPRGTWLTVGLGILSCWPTLTSQEHQVLDLRKKPTPEGKSMGMPGSVIGGIGGVGIIPVSYVLPIETRIQAVRPSSVRPRQKFVIELLLRNTGSVPFYLPASLDTLTVHQAGNEGRRTFLFEIHFLPPDQTEEVTAVMASSQGSKSVAKSLCRLGPKESVSVLFEGDLIPILGWIAAGVRDVSVQATCLEWTLNDERCFIRARSKELYSQNIVGITIQP